MKGSYFFSGVEDRWEKVRGQVWQVSSVALLQVFRVDQLLDIVLVTASIDKQFFVGEFVDKSVSEFPELSHDKGDICGVEAEQATAEVLGHVVHQRLDAVFGDFRHSDVFKVEDASPGLD